MRRVAAPAAALWLILTAHAARAQTDAAAVTHAVSFSGLRDQAVQVTSRFPAGTAPEFLRLPTWAPGSYLQQPFDAGLDLLEVRRDGVPVNGRKIEKDSWRVPRGDGALEVRYRVHAARRDVAASWVSEDYVLLNGSSVFLYTDEARDRPQRLTVAPPAGLPRTYVALPEAAGGGWEARDYDELVDSPVVISSAAPGSFSTDGHDYRLLIVGDASLWDDEQAVSDLEAVVAEANALFGDVPLLRPYWFFNLLNEENGGLEHDHSTVMQASRWQMRDRREYLHWLGLASHEYLHAWNVRRMRPAALARYDYRREQYTDSLWVAEGLTSYYDDLLLSRSGVARPSEYLERLARHLHALELTPGRLRLSLVQASRDAWTRHYQPGVNALNRNVNYYIKGAVVAFVLDARLRRESRGRRSLDDVIRLMWSKWAGQAYPEDAIFEAVGQVSDAETVEWLRPLVEGLAEPDVDEALEWYGLVLERHPVRAAATAAGEAPPAGLGVNWATTGNALVATAVIEGGAAAGAGVIPGDELLAVNGERMTRDNFERRLRRLSPGAEVTLLLVREGRVQERIATLGEARPAYYELKLDPRFGDRQRRRMGDWLGQAVGG